MLNKAHKLLTLVSIATILSPLYCVSSDAAPAGIPFKCVQLSGHPSGSRFATIGTNKLGQETEPIFLWKSNFFSDSGYTPERRCYEVTNRLNIAVDRNKGALGSLFITGGRVNGYEVVCYVNQSNGGCNSKNILFTLSNKNQGKLSNVLASLVNASITGSGNPIQESQGQPYINLEELVNNAYSNMTSSK